MTDADRRVVVTGVGVISSIGTGVDEFWKAAVAGKSGISAIESFDTSSFSCRVGGEIKDFDPQAALGRRRAQRLGRTSQLALAATHMALADAHVSSDLFDTCVVGVAVGSGMGEVQAIERSSRQKMAGIRPNRSRFREYPFSTITGGLLSEYRVTGPVSLFTTACAAGNFAIGQGYEAIKAGEAEVMITGGVDSMSYIAFAGFARIYSLASKCCQPFDKHRKGILVGEGAAFLVLEEREHARRRGVAAYAEVTGCGMTCDAHHITAPDQSGNGICRAMRGALREAGIGPGEVDYISAHGTGTPINDKTETWCIKEVFGEHARSVAVSAPKSMLGHTGGAASAIEAVLCCLTVKHDVMPPTINYCVPDPECDLDYLPNEARRRRIDVALNNAFAFGGNNCCLVFEKDADEKRGHA